MWDSMRKRRVSASVVTTGAAISIGALAYNKREGSKVDNAKWFMSSLIALAIYDFGSDINLSIQIFTDDQPLFVEFMNVKKLREM